ncbi:hypothetical protein [Pseudoalteromonas sp. 5Ae-yellow]|uniref:hypothetical protein n=1 Tax=Pseudoalteromonas sp. RB2-MNA-CIBAN-0110 TaxID=3140439 RepID=UPI00217519D2|nr:hypothetical protein [Pseudoalteromonas sp. 5Ae-yellow]
MAWLYCTFIFTSSAVGGLFGANITTIFWALFVALSSSVTVTTNVTLVFCATVGALKLILVSVWVSSTTGPLVCCQVMLLILPSLSCASATRVTLSSFSASSGPVTMTVGALFT